MRRKYVTFEKDQRMNFLSFSELSDEEKIEIASRIHIDGSNMFSLLSKLTENEANVSEVVGS